MDEGKLETYVSVDVETTGACPGKASMLSIGAATFGDPKEPKLQAFSVNLEPLPGDPWDEATREFWSKYPEALKKTTENQVPIRKGLNDFRDWLFKLPGRPIFVGYPAGYDFTFVYWYFETFAKPSPFGFHAIDIKTMAWLARNWNYSSAVKKRWPKHWFEPGLKHTHIAVDDAIEQLHSFYRIWNELDQVMVVP